MSDRYQERLHQLESYLDPERSKKLEALAKDPKANCWNFATEFDQRLYWAHMLAIEQEGEGKPQFDYDLFLRKRRSDSILASFENRRLEDLATTRIGRLSVLLARNIPLPRKLRLVLARVLLPLECW
jgi:hypothetical protein